MPKTETILGKPKLDLISPLFPGTGGEVMPLPRDAMMPANPNLNLSDSRAVKLNGKRIGIPIGIGKKVTGEAIKALAGIYQGMVLFIKSKNGAQRIEDKQAVELKDGQEYEVQPVPRLTRD